MYRCFKHQNSKSWNFGSISVGGPYVTKSFPPRFLSKSSPIKLKHLHADVSSAQWAKPSKEQGAQHTPIYATSTILTKAKYYTFLYFVDNFIRYLMRKYIKKILTCDIDGQSILYAYVIPVHPCCVFQPISSLT